MTLIGEEQDTVTDTGLGYPHTTEVPTQRDMLTDRDIADRTGFSVVKVRRLMKEGTLPGGKLGGRWLVPVGVWSRYVEGQWNGEAR